ncbi:Cys-tRNA(Pro) deacylase [Aneurinibacillus soli]|uniref:Cys-tRNA(Pro)/Cys-tRNA(Cys) deacylase YbaK n=1 Tax=Aneurinibacillus soli TaxID=1500254 RepID=A0A0U5AVQ4_9BACL|nr:YbaK/EbsC family protein [Aneurinibacillus soli]PYE58968.1 Cys-tRNA(Pro) deacylase [Aneurinibacillus soli]BAU26016.1 Cys-tRNA(Pro)/Cys-tRNA(Cys) deacylase YbaK [Aneurinibacillus soli]
MAIERVREFLKKHGATIEPIVYEEKMHTSEEAARVLGVEIGQIAKSILFRTNDDAYGLFVASGDIRIDSKKVKALIGGKKQKMASAEEVEEVTGFKPGAVCPFALQKEIPIYIDELLHRFDVVYTAAGIPESLLPISPQKLVKITQGSTVKLAKEE